MSTGINEVIMDDHGDRLPLTSTADGCGSGCGTFALAPASVTATAHLTQVQTRYQGPVDKRQHVSLLTVGVAVTDTSVSANN